MHNDHGQQGMPMSYRLVGKSYGKIDLLQARPLIPVSSGSQLWHVFLLQASAAALSMRATTCWRLAQSSALTRIACLDIRCVPSSPSKSARRSTILPSERSGVRPRPGPSPFLCPWLYRVVPSWRALSTSARSPRSGTRRIKLPSSTSASCSRTWRAGPLELTTRRSQSSGLPVAAPKTAPWRARWGLWSKRPNSLLLSFLTKRPFYAA